MSSDANNMDSVNFQKFYPQDMKDSDYSAPSSETRIFTTTARKLNAALVKYQSRGRKFNMSQRRPIETFDGSDAQLLSAEDGSDLLATEAPNILLISLLELFCHKEAKDPIKAKQVFENITKMLVANKMIPSWIMKPGCASNRENLLEYMKLLFLSQPKSLMCKKYDNQLRYTTDFKEIGQVGKGGFGSVYEAVNNLDGRHYAIKKIPIANFPDAVTKVFNEVKTLAALDNPHIVRYHSAWIESYNYENISPPGSNVISKFASKIKEISDSSDSDIIFAESSDSIVFAENSNNNNGLWVEKRRLISAKTTSNESKVQHGNSSENLPVVNYTLSNEVLTIDQDASIKRFHKCVAKISEISVQTNTWSSSSEDENLSQILLIQMELCKGTLKEWLEARNSLPQSQKEVVNDTKNRTIFLGMLQGVRCIHAEGIIHRDLKPANIFLKNTTHAKIGDFGLATSRNQTENKMNSPESDSRYLSCGVGTEFYSAPEQLTGNNYDSKSDIYSLGLILFEMYHPCTTFMERAKIFKDLKESRKMSDFVLKNFPQKAEIIMAMTHPDQTKRPTAKELLDIEQPPTKEEIIRDYDKEVAILKAEIKRLNLELRQKGNS